MTYSAIYQLPPIGADDKKAPSIIDRIWREYQQVRRPWILEVEDNIRMLSGRHYDRFIPSAGQFEDLSEYMMSGDEAWRQQPVFGWVGHVWYPAMLAKLTENLPILGATPATSDAADAVAAQVFDPIFKYEWDQMGMNRRRFDLMGWVLTAGVGVAWLFWDTTRGPSQTTEGPANIPLPDGSSVYLESVPHRKTPQGYVPAVAWDDAAGELRQTHPVGRIWEGDVGLEIPNPVSILRPYGPYDRQKLPWVGREYLMHVDEIKAKFGIEVEPESFSDTPDDTLYGLSYTSPYGMPDNEGVGYLTGMGNVPKAVVVEGMARVRDYWCAATERDGNGRLLICTRSKTLADGENPYVGPPGPLNEPLIPCYVYDRPGFPWRQEGTTDLEALKPVNRAQNRRGGALMDSCDYNELSTLMVNEDAVQDEQRDNFGRRGSRVVYSPLTGEPAHFLNPPPIPDASMAMFGLLGQQMNMLGHINIGDEGGAVGGDDTSGELQREVRFDNDRFLGACLKLTSYVDAQMGLGIMHLLGIGATEPRLISISGEDNAAEFLTLGPEVFAGRINVIPMPESNVLESRQDKQNRITNAFTVIGNLASVDPTGALGKQYADSIGYPDVNRALRPGGQAYSVQVREIVEMARSGIPSTVLPEDADDVHIGVLVKHMQTAAFRRYPPPIQGAMLFHLQAHKANAARKMVEQAQQEIAVQMQVAALSAPLVVASGRIQQEANPEPEKKPNLKVSSGGKN